MKTPRQSPPARRSANRFGTLAMLALAPAVLVLGWRALLVVIGVISVSAVVDRLLREPRHNVRRWPIHLPVDAILLCGLLPARLAGGSAGFIAGEGWAIQLWPLIPFAGIALSLLRRLRGIVPVPPFDPVVIVIIVLHLAIGAGLDPRATLQRGSLFSGDLITAQAFATTTDPWYDRPTMPGEAALVTPWAARSLQQYRDADPTTIGRAGANLDSLIRDKLPPLEDLVLLGHPMPIGMTSGVLLLGVILFGAYRRTIDYRIPLISIFVTYLALVLLPVPTSIGERGASWRLFASLHADIGPATALTFAHYLLFASPALYCLGLLATRGDVRPVQPRAVRVWSILLGLTTAVSILYGSVVYGPLVVLLLSPAVGRWLDRLLARRPLKLPHA